MTQFPGLEKVTVVPLNEQIEAEDTSMVTVTGFPVTLFDVAVTVAVPPTLAVVGGADVKDKVGNVGPGLYV